MIPTKNDRNDEQFDVNEELKFARIGTLILLSIMIISIVIFLALVK